MINKIAPIVLLACMMSCNSNDSTIKTAASHQDSISKNPTHVAETPATTTHELYKQEGDSLLVPSFEIEVDLSAKAKERIVGKKETIVVHVFAEGTPKDNKKVHLEEDGSFFVASEQIEIQPGQVAKFDHFKISKKIYDELQDKDPDITVNIYTGRRSSPDNLITGDLISDKLSKIINRHFTSHQKLIYGDD